MMLLMLLLQRFLSEMSSVSVESYQFTVDSYQFKTSVLFAAAKGRFAAAMFAAKGSL